MNPRLVKFAVELQNAQKEEDKEKKSINFKNGGNKRFFNFFKTAKVTVPIDRID